MAFCTPGVTEQPFTPAGVIFATLPQSPQHTSQAFSWLPAAKGQTKGSERTSFIKASLESVRMGVSVYKTFISGGKQSLKAHSFASNMDKFVGKHGLTITFSHHRSRQTFISHSSVVSIDSCCVASTSFPGENGGLGPQSFELMEKKQWKVRACNYYLYHCLQPHDIPDRFLHFISYNSSLTPLFSVTANREEARNTKLCCSA